MEVVAEEDVEEDSTGLGPRVKQSKSSANWQMPAETLLVLIITMTLPRECAV